MCICSCEQVPRITNHHLVRHGAGSHLLYLSRYDVGDCAERATAACVVLAVDGDGRPGRQRHSCAAGTTECAHFVKLLRLCILTTNMGLADGGSCVTGASAFTMVVVGSGVIVQVTVRDHPQRGAPCDGFTSD
jgi:hypothetical protein